MPILEALGCGDFHYGMILPHYKPSSQLQGILENFDDMVIVMGGGDNLAALAIANYLTGSKLR